MLLFLQIGELPRLMDFANHKAPLRIIMDALGYSDFIFMTTKFPVLMAPPLRAMQMSGGFRANISIRPTCP